MTDIAVPGMRTLDLESEAARARVRARYRAEARFKAYGLIAIALTALFLVIVLSDVLIKGLPAFTQHYLEMTVKVDPAEIDPQGTRDPTVIASGDFQALVRNEMRAAFPEVRDRAGRRQLDGILSTGAADRLRDLVVADPGLVGQSVKFSALLTDDADLYYKGTGTSIRRRGGLGTAAASATTGDVTVTSSAEDFAAELGSVKQVLAERARVLRVEADRVRASLRSQEAGRVALQQGLAAARAANEPTRVATFESRIKDQDAEIEQLARRVAELDQQADALQARATGSGDEALDESLPSLLVAIDGGLVKVSEVGRSKISGTVLLPPASAGEAAPGAWQVVSYVTPEANRRVSDREVAWLERLREQGLVQRRFNWAFFTSGDSREPELAGIRGALVGSALMLLVTLVLCLPIGVAAAIYLEEFAPKNRLTELIEVNINNLAAVPSIVFGLLGLAVFLNYAGLPRSAPLVGGLVLALLVLPTIIIASRAALKAVPPSIKEAALGVGASHQQAIFHHVLPLAMPGIMTGTIIGMAHALGETAPLLMIGMVAFIVEVPTGLTDAATALPVQIYLWSDLPEIAFQSKTAAAIIVLLLFLFVMNGAAIVLRKRFERRW
ncbi:MAG: phosphate ABC transporter, permease protein PstA [Bradyrhizobiaceae bacterium]|nr:MAG: phosphate ABC transporter, permease protein PstA [Bradyrhizobiaceae bacterium]